MATYGIHYPTDEKYADKEHTCVWRETRNLNIGDTLRYDSGDLKITAIHTSFSQVTFETRDVKGETDKWDCHNPELEVKVLLF